MIADKKAFVNSGRKKTLILLTKKRRYDIVKSENLFRRKMLMIDDFEKAHYDVQEIKGVNSVEKQRSYSRWFKMLGELGYTPGQVRRGRRLGTYCPVSRYFVRCLWEVKGIGIRHRKLIDYILFETTIHSTEYIKQRPDKKWVKWVPDKIGRITGLKKGIHEVKDKLVDLGILDETKKSVKINFVVPTWNLSKREMDKIFEVVEEEFKEETEEEEKEA